MTFLVVPVLVIENKGPIDALKESFTLLKKTWGTQIVGNFSFGVIFFLLLIPGFLAMGLVFPFLKSGSTALGLLVLTLVVAYFVTIALIQSALHSIFQAAVYMHTQGVQDETRAFPPNLLGGAMG